MTHPKAHRTATVAAGALALAASLALSACGQRISHTKVLAENAALGTTTGAQAGLGTTSGTGPVTDGSTTGGTAATPTSAATATSGPTSGSTGGSTGSTGGTSTTPIAPVSGGTATTKAPVGAQPTTGTVAPTAAANNGPATGSPVNVGQIGLYSGLVGNIVGTAKLGTQVVVAYINAHGGLNGHRINLISADDGGNPSTGLADAQQMIDHDHVIAFLNEFNPLSSNVVFPYIEKRGVPIVGGIGIEPEYYRSPLAFPGSSSPVIQTEITVKEAINRGFTKIGMLYCAEFNVLCTTNAAALQRDAPKLGGTVVFNQQVSLAQPDYTSQCLSAKSAGVTMLMLAMDPNSVVRLAQDCANQGYHPQYGTLGIVFSSVVLASPNTDGMIAAAADFPFPMQTAATADFQQSFQQVAGGGPTTDLEASAWVGGLILKEAGKALPANPTVADMLAGLRQIKSNSFGGLAPTSFTYVSGRATPTPTCGFIVENKGGQFSAPNGLKPTCIDASFAAGA